LNSASSGVVSAFFCERVFFTSRSKYIFQP
jgi:hypothetical protein